MPSNQNETVEAEQPSEIFHDEVTGSSGPDPVAVYCYSKINGCFQKIGTPQIIHFNRVFH